jgi:hypothetical protein
MSPVRSEPMSHEDAEKRFEKYQKESREGVRRVLRLALLEHRRGFWEGVVLVAIRRGYLPCPEMLKQQMSTPGRTTDMFSTSLTAVDVANAALEEWDNLWQEGYSDSEQ